MARTTYSPQIKAKLVLEVLSGEKELGHLRYMRSIAEQGQQLLTINKHVSSSVGADSTLPNRDA